MSVKYFVDDMFIPNDGSQSIIEDFEKNTSCDICVYPDVHFKRNSKMANGTLISSSNSIFPACLGVENCGFTFGKIENTTKERLIESFGNFSRLLGSKNLKKEYSKSQIMNMLLSEIELEYDKNKYLYDFLGLYDCDEVKKASRQIMSGLMMGFAKKTICNLGGGNHFFEVHEIVEANDKNSVLKKGDLIFMLHSDSIFVGDILFNLFSNLSEIIANSGNGMRSKIKIQLLRLYRKMYFERIGISFRKNKKELKVLFDKSNDYRHIEADTVLGKKILFAHNVASMFGEINRREIINNWCMTQNIKATIIGSHSHDSISIEEHERIRKVVHRNGVQKISDDYLCLLPGAMGSYSYILENSKNEEAYYSTNHGAGRFQDKHIARDAYSVKETEEELSKDNIYLFRVGNCNLSEQNKHAFKNPDNIIDLMKKYNLAYPVAKTKPIAVMKG